MWNPVPIIAIEGSGYNLGNYIITLSETKAVPTITDMGHFFPLLVSPEQKSLSLFGSPEITTVHRNSEAANLPTVGFYKNSFVKFCEKTRLR